MHKRSWLWLHIGASFVGAVISVSLAKFYPRVGAIVMLIAFAWFVRYDRRLRREDKP